MIYHAFNTINGKAYVGQTTRDLKERVYSHYKSGSHSCPALKEALKKYPREVFVWSILTHVDNQKDLNEAEKYWIKHLNTMAHTGWGYNLKEGGRRWR